MTRGARIAAAIEVLEEIAARHRPISEALRDWGLSHRFAGSRDRAAIGNIVYDAHRRRLSIAWIMQSETPRALALGVVGMAWGEGADGLAALLDVPHAPGALTAEEASRLNDADLGAVPDAIRADIPDWLAPSLKRGFGDSWFAEMEAMATRPPLDIRVNRLKSDRPKVKRALSALFETPISPDGLRSLPTQRDGRHPNLQAEPGFRKGWFEIQDEGSQLAALLIGARPGEQILDLCAGGGGKTLALAAAMANKGQIHATDIDKHRLAPIFDRLKRGGTRNVQVRPAGSDLAGLAGVMDRVLVDAPCSGSGAWRRHPDAKWRLSERALADRCAQQTALLRQAATLVKPGGLLVYVTCSLLPEENEDQAKAFIVDMPEFSVLSGDSVLVGAGVEPDITEHLSKAAGRSPLGVQLTPLRTATDGFFIAAFRRGSAQ